MLKRMYVCRSSVINLDRKIFLMYYQNYYLYLYFKITIRHFLLIYSLITDVLFFFHPSLFYYENEEIDKCL